MNSLDAVDPFAGCQTPRQTSAVPLIFGAALLTIALARRSALVAWLRGFFAASRVGVNDDVLPHRTFPQLRDSVIGRSKAAVVAKHGRPRTILLGKRGIAIRAGGSVGGFWREDWWYYPVENPGRAVMAIHFVSGVARQVDFVAGPQQAIAD